MMGQAGAAKVETNASVERVYAETCTNIRATDDVSFKLLGVVPLLSAAAMLAIFLKDFSFSAEKAPLVVFLSIFAALITLGIFRWELRNIQSCSWWIYSVTVAAWLAMPSVLSKGHVSTSLFGAYIGVVVLIAGPTVLSVFGKVRVAVAKPNAER
jgi:hypothetical protein